MITKADRERLLDFYRKAMKDIAESLFRNTVNYRLRPKFTALLSETAEILRKLDKNAKRWVDTNIRRVYRQNVTWTNRRLAARRGASTVLYNQLHEEAIRYLITDPASGLGPRLGRVAVRLGQSVKQYVYSHKTLLRQSRLINQEIAEGILTGRPTQETVDQVTSAMYNTKQRSVLGLPRGNPYHFMVDAPYIQINTVNGVRNLHIEDYVNLVVVTKESEARNTARKNRALQLGIDLAMVSPNQPLVPDVCSIYAGRLFSLTDAAYRRTGYPLMSRTPNGGPPFHPFCTHSLIPVRAEDFTEDEIKEMTENGDPGTRARRGVPLGVLDVDFQEAQRFYKRKGGDAWAIRQNPAIRKAQDGSPSS